MAKILLIDDESIIQKLLKADLAARGYDVSVASDGEEGLELAQLENPDLVLLDVKIPKVTGWDILAALKADEKFSTTQVIIMTGAPNPGDEDKARRMGAFGCLAKPFTPRELMDQIHLAMDQAG